MKKIRQTNFYTIKASVYPKMLWLQRRSADAALSIMHKKHLLTLDSVVFRRYNRYILGYSDAIKLQRRSTTAVMIIATF
jgi:hypothetical protein